MPDNEWVARARTRAGEALHALSADAAILSRQLRRWLLGAPGDPLKPPRDPRVLTKTRIRATRSFPHGAAELIDILLFLHAVDAESEPRRDDLLDAWHPYVEAVLAGEEAPNPTIEHPRIPIRGGALSAVIASMRRYFRVGLFWWEETGIPRRWIVEVRGRARLRLARYVLTRLGGFNPVWSTHLPPLPSGTHFTEPAFRHAHLEAARLLQRAPRIRGIASASWYYDPAIEDVSPHLAFARRIVVENGGITFEVPLDPATRDQALVGSRARRFAAERGFYRPRNVARLWAREPFLAWAARGEGWQLPLAINA